MSEPCYFSVQLIQILLKKFCVTDNPKKFSLYEEYGGDCKCATAVLQYAMLQYSSVHSMLHYIEIHVCMYATLKPVLTAA